MNTITQKLKNLSAQLVELYLLIVFNKTPTEKSLLNGSRSHMYIIRYYTKNRTLYYNHFVPERSQKKFNFIIQYKNIVCKNKNVLCLHLRFSDKKKC